VYSVECQPTFRRNISPPSSGSKSLFFDPEDGSNMLLKTKTSNQLVIGEQQEHLCLLFLFLICFLLILFFTLKKEAVRFFETWLTSTGLHGITPEMIALFKFNLCYLFLYFSLLNIRLPVARWCHRSAVTLCDSGFLEAVDVCENSLVSNLGPSLRLQSKQHV
jgi:hypothetical protein